VQFTEKENVYIKKHDEIYRENYDEEIINV
jgi:hypothetical protein